MISRTLATRELHLESTLSLGTCLKYPLKLCWTLYFPAFLEKNAFFSKFCYENFFFFIKQNVSRIKFWRNMSLKKLSQMVQSLSKCSWLTSIQILRFRTFTAHAHNQEWSYSSLSHLRHLIIIPGNRKSF